MWKTAVNWRFLVVGLPLMVAGYVLLSQVNKDASNWPALVAPPVLLIALPLLYLGLRTGEK